MNTKRAGVATVTIFHHPPTIFAGCIKCRSILSKGEYAILLEIDGYNYFIGVNPPMKCCGDEKAVPILANDDSVAEDSRQAVLAILERDGDTSGLVLLETARFVSVAEH